MARGSFKGLYTFDEVARMYNMDSSNLRKMVQHNKFKDSEIKKFGKTWIITEQAIENHFGLNKLNTYKELISKKEYSKTTKFKSNNNEISCSDEKDIPELCEIVVDSKNIKQNFSFTD